MLGCISPILSIAEYCFCIYFSIIQKCAAEVTVSLFTLNPNQQLENISVISSRIFLLIWHL